MTKLRAIICLMVLLVLTAQAQDRSTLEKQRKKLLQDIQNNTSQLVKIDKDKQKSLEQIDILLAQIDKRQQVITNINHDLGLLNSNIRNLEDIVGALERDMRELKKRYAKMVYYAYRNRSTMNDVVFILSAENFNDAVSRMKYLQQYTQFRKKQAELIMHTKDDLAKKLAELEGKRAEQQVLLTDEVNHRKQLDNEKKQKDQLVTELQHKQKQLLKDAKKKQDQLAGLNKQIEDVIRKEIAAAAKKEKEKNNHPPAPGVKPTPAPDAKLSNRFSENKGRLPWPVVNGVITSGFGQHEHPVIKGLMVNNHGIDIKTDDNAKVKVVCDGEVVDVRSVPGFDNVVMIKHGEYFTVYYRLKSVSVKSGDKVTTKEEIGIAGGEVHFEVSQGNVRLNPTLWLHGQ